MWVVSGSEGELDDDLRGREAVSKGCDSETVGRGRATDSAISLWMQSASCGWVDRVCEWIECGGIECEWVDRVWVGGSSVGGGR